MSINNISTQGAYATGLQQKQQNMNNLFAALKAGDMAAAQKSYVSSGLPVMAQNNTSPLGRLYQALRSEDIAAAQKAALDMKPKTNGKATPYVSAASNKTPTTLTAAQKTAAALGNSKISAQQSSVFALLGIGSNVDTST